MIFLVNDIDIVIPQKKVVPVLCGLLATKLKCSAKSVKEVIEYLILHNYLNEKIFYDNSTKLKKLLSKYIKNEQRLWNDYDNKLKQKIKDKL